MSDNPDTKQIVEKLTDKSKDLSRWYTEVILMAQLADYAPVKGCMVIRPYGYAIWESIKERLDKRLKETGHVNAYFPLLIPESFLSKEAEHVKGFAPEVAWVTQGGNHQLEERLAIRPTSEAIICHMYAKWIRSWRDLPVLINQWVNVLRWEMVTRPFLRTTEFLWQEGHTVHATEAEAEEEALKILGLYQDLIQNDLAMPVIIGRKSEKERFAGALRTYTLEALMPDGKALQAGTSHNLGQGFAKAFGISFLDEEGKRRLPWQTSWGVSTRLIGGVILSHGDDAGLIIPPNIAPTQVVIVPIWQSQTYKQVREKVDKICNSLKSKFRVEADVREGYTPGWKFNEHEMRGVPIRIEIGPKDIEKAQVVMVRRDTREKKAVAEEDLQRAIEKNLTDIQENLFEKAKKFREKNTREVSDFQAFKRLIDNGGFLKAGWCGDEVCEMAVKDQTTATIRAIPFDSKKDNCVHCGKAGKLVYFAKSY